MPYNVTPIHLPGLTSPSEASDLVPILYRNGLVLALAILFVCTVTLFSLCTQALFLGLQGATLSFQLHISTFELIVSVLPHAL